MEQRFFIDADRLLHFHSAAEDRSRLDPIRSDSGFQQLLAGKELIGPNQ
jgi:hypothetical protein